MANNNDFNKNNKVNVKEMIANNKEKKSLSNITEKMVPVLLFLITAISILTTIGIIYTLLSEAVEFFRRVPIWEFFTSVELDPFGPDPEFGILPLINGTIISSLIAMVVAGPIGLMSAVYLSEYASEKVRRTLKPLLEVLAGIPTIVYGFFCLYLCYTDFTTDYPWSWIDKHPQPRDCHWDHDYSDDCLSF